MHGVAERQGDAVVRDGGLLLRVEHADRQRALFPGHAHLRPVSTIPTLAHADEATRARRLHVPRPRLVTKPLWGAGAQLARAGVLREVGRLDAEVERRAIDGERCVALLRPSPEVVGDAARVETRDEHGVAGAGDRCDAVEGGSLGSAHASQRIADGRGVSRIRETRRSFEGAASTDDERRRFLSRARKNAARSKAGSSLVDEGARRSCLRASRSPFPACRAPTRSSCR